MQIKYLQKQYSIELEDLEQPTLGALKEKIRKTVKECAGLSDDKILMFHNKAKVSGSGETSLSDAKISNESTLFVVVISGSDKTPSQEEKKTSQSHAQSSSQQNVQQPFGMGQPGMGMGMGGDPMSMERQVLDQIISNPDSVMQMMEAQMPNMSEEQKKFMRQNIEIIKNNPDLVKQMFNNPMLMNAMRSPNMNPMMSPNMNSNMNPMMGSPMMNPMMNPMMSPMMNPNMNPMMMNQMYGYNPYMMNPYAQQQQAPANGPCSHGFYPPKHVDGRPEPQDAETVYAEKITSLNEMGFADKDENIRALLEAKGDISEAIEILSRKYRS